MSEPLVNLATGAESAAVTTAPRLDRPVVTPEPMRVLIIDDDVELLHALSEAFVRSGHSAVGARNSAEGLRIASVEPIDAVILDVAMPELDGRQVLERLRSISDVPVIMLSGAYVSESDRVDGLRHGADDYLVKPVGRAELVARTERQARRATAARSSVIEAGRLRLDLRSRETLIDGRPVHLTGREFDLLALLASRPRELFTKRRLLELVWGSSPEFQDVSTVKVHIGRLRAKLERDPSKPVMITAETTGGYRFVPEAD